MATRTTAKNDIKSIGTSTLLHMDVEKINIDHNENNRFAVADEQSTIALAVDILSRSSLNEKKLLISGQLQAVTIDRDPDNGDPNLLAGFGRATAIDFINANPNHPAIEPHLIRLQMLDQNKKLRAVFPIKVHVIAHTDLMGRILTNLAENAHRRDLTDMDWAVTIGRLLKLNPDLSDQDLVTMLTPYRPTGRAEFSTSWVQQHRYLLDMAPSLQKAVANGEIPISRAIEAWRNTKDLTVADPKSEGGARAMSQAEKHAEQDKLIESAKGADGKVDSVKFVENNRAKAGSRGANVTLTLAEVTKTVKMSMEQTGSTVATAFFQYLKGKRRKIEILSFLATFAPADFKPAGTNAKATGKKGGKKPGRKKIGTDAAPAAVGTSVVPEPNQPSGPATTPTEVAAQGQQVAPKRGRGRRGANVVVLPWTLPLANVAPEASSAESSVPASALVASEPANTAPVEPSVSDAPLMPMIEPTGEAEIAWDPANPSVIAPELNTREIDLTSEDERSAEPGDPDSDDDSDPEDLEDDDADSDAESVDADDALEADGDDSDDASGEDAEPAIVAE